MDYVYKIDTEASVYTEASPKRTLLNLTRGRIKGGAVYFPAGPAGVLHLKLVQGAHQVYPASSDQALALDDAVFPLNLDLALHAQPYDLVALTWNDSDTYTHTLTLVLYLDPFANVQRHTSWLSRLIAG